MPVFDSHCASIGAIGVAPSNPSLVYVGTGEPTCGDSDDPSAMDVQVFRRGKNLAQRA